MDIAGFTTLITTVTGSIPNRPLGPALMADLNSRFPAGGPEFKAIEAACHAGIKDGWICKHEAGGIRYGRIIKPGPTTHGFSVDVVLMADIKGPHHRHPKGEIDMIMPISPQATFDGRGAGWLVYAADSAHHPTVDGGEALILYLLPDGEIEFTK